MAGPYHGKTGTVQYNSSAVASLQSWSFDTSIDVADTTAMGATNSWESQVTGLSDFSGTAEGLSSKGLSPISWLGSNNSLVFVFGNGGDDGQFEGNAILTGLSETVSIDDVGKISYTFEGNDTLGLSFTAGSGDTVQTANPFHGKNARVIWGDTATTMAVPKPTEWSVSLGCDTADSTAMAGTNNGRTRLAGFKNATASWTAQVINASSAGAFVNSAGTAIALGDISVVEFWRTGSSTDGGYYGTAEITGLSTSMDSRGVQMANYTAKFDGSVSNTIS